MLLKSVHYFHFSTLLDIETKKNKTTIYCVFIESDVIIMMGKQHLTFGLATGVITIFTLKELGFTEVWNNSFCLLTLTGLGSFYAKRANITKNEIPIILVFAVDTLLKNNINIYFFNNDVFLTDDIPANCILKTINLSK